MPLSLIAENCGTSLLMIQNNYAQVLARTRRRRDPEDLAEAAGGQMKRQAQAGQDRGRRQPVHSRGVRRILTEQCRRMAPAMGPRRTRRGKWRIDGIRRQAGARHRTAGHSRRGSPLVQTLLDLLDEQAWCARLAGILAQGELATAARRDTGGSKTARDREARRRRARRETREGGARAAQDKSPAQYVRRRQDALPRAAWVDFRTPQAAPGHPGAVASKSWEGR